MNTRNQAWYVCITLATVLLQFAHAMKPLKEDESHSAHTHVVRKTSKGNYAKNAHTRALVYEIKEHTRAMMVLNRLPEDGKSVSMPKEQILWILPREKDKCARDKNTRRMRKLSTVVGGGV